MNIKTKAYAGQTKASYNAATEVTSVLVNEVSVPFTPGRADATACAYADRKHCAHRIASLSACSSLFRSAIHEPHKAPA